MPQPLPQSSPGMPVQAILSARESSPDRTSSLQATAVFATRQTQRPCGREADGDSRRDGGQSIPLRESPEKHRQRPEPVPGQGVALLLGADRVLIQSRRDILKHFGYGAKFHLVHPSFVLPSLSGITVVHLCQTIKPEEAARLARVIRALRPDIAILYTEKVRQPEPDDFDELLPPLMHPEAYLEAISSFLRHRA